MPQRMQDRRPVATQAPAAETAQRRGAARAVSSAIDHSPRMQAQRRAIAATFGGHAAVDVAQRKPQPVVQRAFFDEAKVGLELTFNNPFTQAFSEKGFAGTSAEAAKRQWDQLQNSWETQVGGYGPASEPVEVDKSRKNKNIGGAGEFSNYEFRYNMADGEEDPQWWWYRLSLDPGVLEIQTAPTPGSSFVNTHPIGAIVEDHIFGIATNLGLQAGGGGGHVNVDFATGFGSDHSLIPSLLLATDYEKNSTGPHDHDHDLIDHANEGDDPFLGTARKWLEYKTVGSGKTAVKQWNDKGFNKAAEKRDGDWATKLGGLKPSDKTWDSFRRKHAEWLHAHPTTAQYNKATSETGANEQFGDKLDEGTVEKVLHYQAVNIDHVAEDDEAQRRLEFRFFKGQDSLDEIRRSVRMIERIKTKAEELKRG